MLFGLLEEARQRDRAIAAASRNRALIESPMTIPPLAPQPLCRNDFPQREAFAGLDPLAFALALRHMESIIALMMVGEVDDADMLPHFATVYALELRVLERVVASGRSREDAAALLGRRMAPFPPDQRPELSDIMERRRALHADPDAVADVHEALHAPAEEPDAEEAPAEPDPAEKP